MGENSDGKCATGDLAARQESSAGGASGGVTRAHREAAELVPEIERGDHVGAAKAAAALEAYERAVTRPARKRKHAVVA